MNEVDELARDLAEANGTGWDFVLGGNDDKDPYYRDARYLLEQGWCKPARTPEHRDLQDLMAEALCRKAAARIGVYVHWAALDDEHREPWLQQAYEELRNNDD